MVFIYDNKEKDKNAESLKVLISKLEKSKVEYRVLEDEDMSKTLSADAVFAIGGDGTILFISEFSKRNNIPIIGINAGKLGFLCEFEKNSIDDAVNLFLNGNLVQDRRLMLKVSLKDEIFYALNELYVQRIYSNEHSYHVASISVDIDDITVSNFNGDGAIICTPTGSTAYSFSLGAPLLAPHAAAFLVTPIASHSFNQRPIVYSAGSKCSIKVNEGIPVDVFVDGLRVGVLNGKEKLIVTCAEKPLAFLRRKDYNFFAKLSSKLNSRVGGDFNE